MTCELIRSNCVVRGTMKNMLTYSAYFRWSCWRLSEPLYLMLTQTLTLPVWLTLRAWTVCLNLISSGHTYVTCNTAEKPGHVRYKLNFLSQAQFSISNCFSQHPDFSFHIMCLFFFFARIICKIYLLGMLCNKVVCMLLFWLVSLLLSKLNLFILCWLDCQKL